MPNSLGSWTKKLDKNGDVAGFYTNLTDGPERMTKIFGMLMMSLVFCACSESSVSVSPPGSGAVVDGLKGTPELTIDLQEVVNTYVLGGSHTDLQREEMTAKLSGATVTWKFKVYDIAKEDGRYKVMSELMEGSGGSSIGKFGVVAFVTPTGDQDIQTLLKLQTGSAIVIRGRVDSIAMRTALVLSPAFLVH